MSEGNVQILFSDHFGVSEDLIRQYGAFNVSLLSDLSLFIDPFLLFNSEKSEYRQLHEQIIRYLTFLRDKSISTNITPGLLKEWYFFKEVKQTWLGFARSGNKGSALGAEFANALNENFPLIFKEYGTEQITRSSHLEKLCLIKDGVGRDRISDFATNMIKGYLLSFTEKFAYQHLQPNQCRAVSVPRASFNYVTERWDAKGCYLPRYRGDFVLLVPRDLLTRDDTWINRPDFIKDFDDIPGAIPDESLRDLVNNFYQQLLPKNPKRKDELEAIERTLAKYPELIDYFIRFKEESGEQAVSLSDERVTYAETLFLENFTNLVSLLAEESDFYDYGTATLNEAVARIHALKDIIERRDGYKLFYDMRSNPISREDDLRVAYMFSWYNQPNGPGRESGPILQPTVADQKPLEVKAEFKLASNKSLYKHLLKLTELDEDGRRVDAKGKILPPSVTAIFIFTDDEKRKLDALLQETKLDVAEDVIMIDARKQKSEPQKEAKGIRHGFGGGYALIIGIADYPGMLKLPSTVRKDATDLRDVLCSTSYAGYQSDHIRLLLDGEATAEGIRDGFRWLAAAAGTEDTATIFFSGHGGRFGSGEQTLNYLIPYDYDPNQKQETAISGTELTKLVRAVRTAKVVMLLDSCHSGGTGDPKQAAVIGDLKSGLDEQYFERLSEGTGRVIMASSRSDEVSLVLRGMDNSLFTHYVLEALRGKAINQPDGLIRVFDVFSYVSDQVPARAEQHPVFKATDVENNFPIALNQGGKKGSSFGNEIPTNPAIDKRVLREAIVKQYNTQELEVLCADVQQDLENEGHQFPVSLEIVGGSGKISQVLCLIEYLDRRHYLQYLVEAVRRDRPESI